MVDVRVLVSQESSGLDLADWLSICLAALSLIVATGLWVYERRRAYQAALDARKAYAQAIVSLAGQLHDLTDEMVNNNNPVSKWVPAVLRIQAQASALLNGAPPVPTLLLGTAQFIEIMEGAEEIPQDLKTAHPRMRTLVRQAAEAAETVSAGAQDYVRPPWPHAHPLARLRAGIARRVDAVTRRPAARH